MSHPLLADDLMVLGHHCGTGKPLLARSRLSCGMAGAVLADLLTVGRIAVVDGKVRPTGTTPTGDEHLDAYAATVAAARTPRTIRSWVRTLHSGRTFTDLTRHTASRGLIRYERSRVLLVFTSHRYLPTSPADRDALVLLLRGALTRSRSADPRTSTLLSLVVATGLDRPLYGDLPPRDHRRLAKAALAGNEIAEAVHRVIQEAESASVGIGTGV